MRANSKKLIAKFLSSFLFTLTVLLTGLGFIPTAFAVDAATVTVPGTVQVQANSATKSLSGLVSVGGLPVGTTYLVAIGMTNNPSGSFLRMTDTASVTASYGFTSGANTFTSFANISFRGTLAAVNSALASLTYTSGASGDTNPTIKVTATSYDVNYAINGYNGHLYKFVSGAISYTSASTAAQSVGQRYKGQNGYVVTITDSGENSFVNTAILNAQNIWIGATDATEGYWKWEAGGGSPEQGKEFWRSSAPPAPSTTSSYSSAGANYTADGLNYSNWCGSEPNNSDGSRGGEDHAVTNWGGGSCWNDLNTGNSSGIGGYVIEYGTNDASTDYGFDNADSDLRSASFTLSYTPTLTGTTQNLNVTFGTAGYDTVTATNGTGNKTFTRTSNPGNAGITLNTSVTNQAVLIVASGVPSGTYYETITATDAASVTANFVITVTVSIPPSSDTDSAIVFNGTNQYAIASGDVSGFDIANAITVETWIYPTGSNCDGYIVVKTFSYYLYCSAGILHYLLVRSNDGGGVGVSTGITIPVNQWSHIAMTRDTNASTANIYINGILQFSGASAATTNLFNSSRLLAIGAQDSAENYFAGQIDEVKLWNIARSASEVMSDLKTYGGSLSSGLVAYYDFNDLYGTYVANRSTGGSATLNLTITNSPTLSSAAIFTTTSSSPYSITRFTRNYLVANNGWKSPVTSRIKYLVVAGGGGGGAGYNAGGGGAGGYLESTTSITANTYYPIVVGVGGRGGIKIYGPTNGETSTAFSVTAVGGGSGGTEQSGMSGPNNDARSGGSGGGGNHATPSILGASGTTGQGSRGGNGLSNGAQFVGGGGGGAGAVGTAATTSSPGNGGAGNTSTITGLSVNLAGGGGGAGRSTTSSRTGTASFGGGAGGIDLGVSGTTNTGGGGGGATSGATYGVSTGGSGGSGVIVLRYLTTNPTINLQPANDTTTAGLTDSFTVGSTTISSPFTKSVKWQVATDTVTAAASVSWIDITSGSGSTNGTGFTTDTFTTATLTTAMNKFRYRAIVTFSDSDSLTVVETSTVAILTINPAITFTSDTSTVTRKYGASGLTRTVTYTGGTDTRTVSASATSLASGKITFNTSTALFTIDTRTAVGTWLDTITVTDAKGATASYVQTIIFTVADTLTVTSDTPTALTFTGSEAVFNPSITVVSGLVSGDVVSGATYNYSSNTVPTCAQGGACSFGERGPAGGIVFYVSGSAINSSAGISSGGIYLEAAPAPVSKTTFNWCEGGVNPYSRTIGASATAIGSGASNTATMIANCTGGAGVHAANLTLGGYSDWFLPSSSELSVMYSNRSTIGVTGNEATYLYWGSTEWASTSAASLVPWSGVGGQNKGQATPYWPIRAFSQTVSSLTSYGPSTTKPTNAATYTITPSVLSFSDGAEANYANIIYRTSTLTINKAAQAALTVVPLYNVFNGNPTSATLLTTGGSDTGTVTYAYVSSLSTAGGCALSGVDSSTVTVTSAGTCRIVATKAATNNYLVAVSDTGTVTFYLYVTNIPGPRPAEYPTEIVLSGATAMTSNGLAPTITTTGVDFTAKSPGGTFTISGSGFVGTRLVRVAGTTASFTVLSNTSLQVTMPTGLVGISGPIYVEKAEGSRVSEDWVTGTA